MNPMRIWNAFIKFIFSAFLFLLFCIPSFIAFNIKNVLLFSDFWSANQECWSSALVPNDRKLAMA